MLSLITAAVKIKLEAKEAIVKFWVLYLATRFSICRKVMFADGSKNWGQESGWENNAFDACGDR